MKKKFITPLKNNLNSVNKIYILKQLTQLKIKDIQYYRYLSYLIDISVKRI